jgi:hypothetical protein
MPKRDSVLAKLGLNVRKQREARKLNGTREFVQITGKPQRIK